METTGDFILLKFCSGFQPFWFHQGHLISNPIFSANSPMKRLLYSVCLLVLTVACESDVFPTDLLYQRWEFFQSRRGNSPWSTFYKPTVEDTEYKSDGTLVYRVKGQVQTLCCQPVRFKRQKNNLTFAEVTPCGYVACIDASSRNATITQLTDDLLELTTDETVSQYRSVK